MDELAINATIIKGDLICLVLINLLLSSFFVHSISCQEQEYLFECSIIDSVQALGYPEINNHMPPGAEPSCYLASDPCIDRYPFSENWENINPVTIRLNFHFIKTGDVGLNFGEEDGNCPSCSSNDNRSIYDQANYFIQELNRSASGMNDFLKYYDENGNKLDPPTRFKDEIGAEVPNLGDTKLRFELYEENGQGSVHIHEIDDYKFENSQGDMQGPCEDGQITLDNLKADFSVYGDKVIDIFFYDEWAPIHGYNDSEGDFKTCRVIRGSGYQYDYFIKITNFWYFWQYTRQNEPNSEFGRWNLRSILWHELGHVFGLGHTFPRGLCCDANEEGLQNQFGGTRNVTNNTMGYNNHFVTFSPCQLDKIFNRLYKNDFEWAILDPNFDIEDQNESLTPAIAIDGQSEVTWDQNTKVTKHIFIEPGSRLNIEAEIRMAPDAHIFVKRGAMLHIAATGKITNFNPDCDQWGGVWIEGNLNRDHPDSRFAGFTGDGKDPGRVVISKGVVQNARWGVNSGLYLISPNLFFPFWPTPFLVHPGGYIYADQATFKGCDQAVRFLPYGRENKSKFLACEFENEMFTDFPMQVGVVIDRNFGIEFQSCTFDGLLSHGILMKDASFNIHNKNTFKNIQGTAISALYTGMYVPFQYRFNIGKDDFSLSSSGNDFVNNNLDIRVENFSVGRKYLTIKSNSFNSDWDSSSPGQNQQKNIEVFASNVQIVDNSFSDSYNAISLNCSRFYETEIINNDFINFHTAIWYENWKSGSSSLHTSKFACNSFSGNTSSGILLDQARIVRQGNNLRYLNNTWIRDANNEPVPGVYDIRVKPLDGIGASGNNPIFTYSVEQNTPLLDPARPLCNLTSTHPNCQSPQAYELYEQALNPDCGEEDANIGGSETLTLNQIQSKLDSMDQFGDNSVPGQSCADLEGREYRLIKRLVDSLVPLNQYNMADSLLALEDDLAYVQLRFGLRLKTKDFDQARAFLNALNGETEEVGDFKTVQHLHLDFISDSTYNKDSFDIQTLETIAEKRHLPSSHARALLSIIDGRSWDPIFPQTESMDSVTFHFSDEKERLNEQTLVFPNPGEGLFTIIPNGETLEKDSEVQFHVFDLSGNTVLQLEQPVVVGGQYPIDLTDVSDGMYFLYIKQGGHQETHKIIKQ